MFTETAAMAEVEYRQRRFLEEAQAHRQAKLARSAAPARKPRMGPALAQLTQLAPRRIRRIGRSRASQEVEAAADSGGSATCAA